MCVSNFPEIILPLNSVILFEALGGKGRLNRKLKIKDMVGFLPWKAHFLHFQFMQAHSGVCYVILFGKIIMFLMILSINDWPGFPHPKANEFLALVLLYCLCISFENL